MPLFFPLTTTENLLADLDKKSQFSSCSLIFLPVPVSLAYNFKMKLLYQLCSTPLWRVLFLSVLSLLLVACQCSGGKNRTDFELFHDMIQQKSLKAQEGDETGSVMRLPPENTRARNRKPYPYKGDPEGAEKHLKNPFQNQMAPDLIAIGKRQYEKTCILCHGPKGDGQGSVAQKMTVKPLSLLSLKAINLSDGRIYHIIQEGQGLMQGYSKQVRGEKNKWALVNYVRMLQNQALTEKTAKHGADDSASKAVSPKGSQP